MPAIVGSVPIIKLCNCAIFLMKNLNKSTTANGGSLGSLVDEERS
jgi:hypothetical protein